MRLGPDERCRPLVQILIYLINLTGKRNNAGDVETTVNKNLWKIVYCIMASDEFASNMPPHTHFRFESTVLKLTGYTSFVLLENT